MRKHSPGVCRVRDAWRYRRLADAGCLLRARRLCSQRGVFLSWEISFAGETRDSFGAGKLNAYVGVLAQSLAVDLKDIEWEEPVQFEDSARRQRSASTRSLWSAHSLVRVRFRVLQPTFAQVDRVRLAAIALLCSPSNENAVDFSCEHGPAVWYNASQLNAIPPPPPPTSVPPAPMTSPPPPPAPEPFKVDLMALLISLCALSGSIFILILWIRFSQERRAFAKLRGGQITWSQYCCLILFAKPPSKHDDPDERYAIAIGVNQHRSVTPRSFGKPKQQARRNKSDITGESYHQEQQDRIKSGEVELSRRAAILAIRTTLLMDENDSNKRGLPEEPPTEPVETLAPRLSSDKRSDEVTDSPQLAPVPSDARQVWDPKLSAASTAAALHPRAGARSTRPSQGVEFSTKTELRWVGKAVMSNEVFLSSLSPPPLASRESRGISAVQGASNDVVGIIEFDDTDSLVSPARICFTSQTASRGLERAPLCGTPTRMHRLPPAAPSIDDKLKPSRQVSTPPITAELGFMPSSPWPSTSARRRVEGLTKNHRLGSVYRSIEDADALEMMQTLSGSDGTTNSIAQDPISRDTWKASASDRRDQAAAAFLGAAVRGPDALAPAPAAQGEYFGARRWLFAEDSDTESLMPREFEF